MCGLAGVARVGGLLDRAETEPVLRRMLNALRHRGPDDERVLLDDEVGLAFTRLSLVDPEGGGQPLFSADRSVVLIANGEIYNHAELAAGLPAGTRPRTRSDCEVLVHLYQRDGLRFLDRVRGMFSLVLWDRKAQRLLLAKDRFGIKPLLYHRDRDHLVFASEIKALLEDPACPRAVDWERALTDQSMTGAPYFTDGRPVSWYRGIEHVPPATIIDISLRDGRTTEHRYWELPTEPGSVEIPDAELVDTHRELLRAAVVDSCMADVEIGLFLSGGVDSAAVAAFAAKELNLHTFTALSPTTMASGDAEYGHRVATALGLPNHQVLFDVARVPDPEEWKRLLWLVEMPQCGPEQFFKYELHRFVRERHPGIKAMLLGGGADEYNGGYTAGLAGGTGWPAFLDTLRGLARRRATLSRPELGFWDDGPFPLLADAALERYSGATVADPYTGFAAWKHRDVAQYNCWHEDRTAGGNGIEARVPFLDHRLVELIATMPAQARARLLWDKRILRDGMTGLLPDDVVNRPKVAFYHGDGVEHTHRTFIRMLARDGGALVEQALAAPNARDLLDADGIRATLRALVEDHRAAPMERLLRVVNLGLLDAMVNDLPAHPATAAGAAVPVSVPVTDWDLERDRLAAITLRRPEVSGSAVLALAGNVLLLNAPAEPELWYLAVDGSIAYVVDGSETPDWLRFLRAVDGRRDLTGVLAASAARYADVTAELRDAIDLGVLVVAAATEPPMTAELSAQALT